MNPFRNIQIDHRKFDAGYINDIMPEMAVAVGLAIRGVN
jgi:Tfp pilus assembly PilM family ATPase